MKRLAFAAFGLLLSLPAFGQGYQTPVDVYADILPVLSSEPSLSEIEICVEGSCEVFEVVHERKGGSADVMYQRPKGVDGNDLGGAAGAVGGILGQIGGKVGAGGRVVVDYSHTKGKDGSEKTKVKVEISIGAGSAAEGAVQK